MTAKFLRSSIRSANNLIRVLELTCSIYGPFLSLAKGCQSHIMLRGKTSAFMVDIFGKNKNGRELLNL